MPSIKKLFILCLLGFSLCTTTFAENLVVEEKPSAMAMMGDLIIVRPVMLGVSVLGAAAYVVSLPFTLAGGNAGEAGEALVVEPLKTTFVRCLGCVKPGYKKQVQEVEGQQ